MPTIGAASRARAHLDLRRARARGFPRARRLQGIERGEFVTRFTLICPLGEAPSRCMPAARTTSSTPVRGRRGERRGRLDRRRSSRASSASARFRAACSSRPAARQLDHRRFLQRESEFGARGPRGAALAARSQMAGVRRYGRTRCPYAEASHADIGATRANAASSACSRSALGRRAPSRASAAGAEWFADAELLVRRLRGGTAAGVTVLIKGSRVNRLERVVQGRSSFPLGLRAEGRHAALPHRISGAMVLGLPRVPVPHAARNPGGDDRARDRARRRAAHDRG
jgi:hypothetical protein